MSLETISQPAKPGDLILAYIKQTRRMFLVTSTGSEQDSSDTSIIRVKRIRYSLGEKEGRWALSGPEVYHIEGTDDKRQDIFDSDDSTDDENDRLYREERTLRQFLDGLPRDRSGESLVECLVNPHGREVLKHYFLGYCHYCYNETLFCPGCGDVSRYFPYIRGSCSVFLSCPVCIGYDIALDERMGLRALEWEEEQVKRYQRKAKESKLSRAERQKLRKHKHDIEGILTDKYETLHKRKEEMGFSLDDVDKLVKDDMNCIFD